MFRWLKSVFVVPARHHFWGSLGIVLFSSVVIWSQVADRHGFANSELHQDVMERWGTPINQPAPSVRYVDKLTWSGRLKPGEKCRFDVFFKGRGLDTFTYRLDPSLPSKDFTLSILIHGGENYDYPWGVVPAHKTEQTDQGIQLNWHYPSLESGVPVGATLPSVASYDDLITTMARRSWAPFIALFSVFVALAATRSRRLRQQGVAGSMLAQSVVAGPGFLDVKPSLLERKPYHLTNVGVIVDHRM